MKITGLIVVMLILAITAYGSSNAIYLTEADNGCANSVNVGSEIKIVLKGNPTTGYTWEVDSFSTNKLQQIGSREYCRDEQSGAKLRVGVGGEFMFRFKAVQQGKGDIQMIYRRSWETTAYDKVYSVVFEIR